MVKWLVQLLRYPRLTLSLGLVFCLLSLSAALHRLQFTTDRTQLLDPKNPVQRDWNRFRQTFGQNSDWVVLVKAPDAEQGRLAVEMVADQLRRSAVFQDVFYRLDLKAAARSGLFFLQREDLRQLRDWLSSAQPWLDSLAQGGGALGVLEEVSRLAESGQLAPRMKPVLPFLVRTLEGLEASLQSGGRAPFVSPLGPYRADVRQLQGRSLRPGQTLFYNQLADGRTYMLIARSENRSGSFQVDLEALHTLRSIVGTVRRSFPDVNLMVSGEPAINTEEMEDARQDAYNTAVTAVAAVSVLLVLAFGQISRPMCVVLSLLMGLSWSVGVAALTVGQLNLLTVHFVTILTGLGITFGIQVLSHFQSVRGRQKSALTALLAALSEARHQSMGALATAIAFYSLYFTSFRAAAQLGWITGTGVLLCYLASVTMLPSMLVLLEHGRPCPGFPQYGRLIAPFERWLRGHYRWIGWACIGVTLVSALALGRIDFDWNLLNLQARNAEAIRVEHFLQRAGYSTLYAASLAPNAAEARRRMELLEKLPSVARVESVLSLEPNEAAAKQPLVSDLVDLAGQLEVPVEPGGMGASELRALYRVYERVRPQLLQAAEQLHNEPEGPRLRELLVRLERLLDPGNPGPLSEGLQSYQRSAFDDLRRQLDFLKQQQSDLPDVLGNVPPELRMRSIAPNGTVCLRIFPREDCWEREPLTRFVSELRTVDPHVTGTPVLIYTYLEQLKKAYTLAARNALLVIVVMLLLYYRSVSFASLALLPKLSGVCWMMGALWLLGEPFNPANFLALPLTLGIGLIFGIESLRICKAENQPLMCSQSAGFAMALSGLTTMVGFSILMQAQHRGVESFGLVMTLGVAANLLTALLMLPALLLSEQDYSSSSSSTSTQTYSSPVSSSISTQTSSSSSS